MKQRLQNDMRAAMKASNKVALDCLRMMIAEIKKVEIDTKKEMDDAGVIKVLKKGIKSRQDSVAMFERGGRQELAEKEKKEIEILSGYLPRQLSESELEKVVAQKIAETGATTKAQIGQVMKAVMAQFGGEADGKTVQRIAASKLS
jgi:uncharacterized protein